MKSAQGWDASIAKLLVVALLSCGGAEFALGQVTAAISGRVEDPSGAAVAGATVTVTSEETAATRTFMTDDAGNYRFLAMPVGRYDIHAEKTGFKGELQKGLNLAVGQQAVLNIQLSVGAVQEQVTVTGEAALVNTTTSSIAGLVGEQQVKELPLNGRSFDMLITLNPGTSNYTAVARNQGSSGTGTNLFSVGGKRPNANLFVLNGVEYTGTGNVVFTPGGASGQLLGIDAVREFNVISDAYGAELGKRSGGQISVVTQSGTNQLHGSVFEFMRNSAFDARNYFDHIVGTPPFKRNQFGGALGGPVKKDNVFLFGNYEGFTQRLGISATSLVPDLNMRQGKLPCGTALAPTVTCAAGTPAGTPTLVPNQNPKMLQYMNSFWPTPNGGNILVPATGLPSGIAYAYGNPVQSIAQHFGTLRADEALTDKDNLSESYTIDDGNNLSPTASDQIFGSTAIIRNQVASVQETHVFSPTVINSFTAGVSRANNQTLGAPIVPVPSNLYFVPGTTSPGAITIGAVGGLTSQGISTGGNHTSYRSYRRTAYSLNDGLQVVRGIHQFSFGGSFQRLQENDTDGLKGSGQASFSNLTTLLQGTVANFQYSPIVTEMGWRTWEGAWYVQDSIQLKKNLTIRVGLRDEFSNGWSDVNGRAETYQFVGAVIQTLPTVGSRFGTGNNQKALWSPRVGVAWDPFRKGKTSIRAAAGIYYDLVDTLSYLVDQTPPFNGSLTFASQPLFNIIPAILGSEPAPCGPGVPTPCSTFAPKSTQPDFKTPAINSWNFTVEQQLNGSMALRVGYVGFTGHHQFVTIDPNTIPAQVCANAAGCLAGGVNAATSKVQQGQVYIPAATARPNPYMGSGLYLNAYGNASYNAFQTDLAKRLTKGLQFRANYTWSKSLDTSSGLIGNIHANEQQTVVDVYHAGSDWGPSGMDIRHQFSANMSYELPLGAGKQFLSGAHGITGKIVGGWQVNSIVTKISGFTLTPGVGSNQSGNGDLSPSDRPNMAPGLTYQTAVTGNPNQWFNPVAFLLPQAGTFGNLGRGALRGPGLANWDFSLFKNTAIHERLRLQFRAEIFNILNHTNFGAPTLPLFSSGAPSPTAGQISNTTTTAREIQFGLKLIF